jgi:hypothetical protein
LPVPTEASSAVKVGSRNLNIQKAPNWTCTGKVIYRENSPAFVLPATGSYRGGTEIASALLESSIFENCRPVMLAGRNGLKPVLEVFDLPAPYRPFNPMFQGQLSGDDFTNSSTRQEPGAVFGRIAPYLTFVGLTTTLTVT